MTGYDSEFSADGVMEINEAEQKSKRVDREDIIKMAKSGEVLDFVYGDRLPVTLSKRVR